MLDALPKLPSAVAPGACTSVKGGHSVMMDSQPPLSSLPGRPSRRQSQQSGMEIWGSGLQALIACLLSRPQTATHTPLLWPPDFHRAPFTEMAAPGRGWESTGPLKGDATKGEQISPEGEPEARSLGPGQPWTTVWPWASLHCPPALPGLHSKISACAHPPGAISLPLSQGPEASSHCCH